MSLSKHLAPKPSSLKVGSEISRGGNGTVYAGELNGRPVAVKVIHRILLEAAQDGQGDELLTAFRRECTRLERIIHPLVVGFKGAFYDHDSDEPILVMELMKQDLSQLLRAEKGKLTYRKQVQLCLDVSKGLHFLHTQDPPLVHRDLSAKNVLLDESGRAKIGDLGQSKLKTTEYFKTKQPGAVPYMPPEALAEEPHYNEKIDIFSYGVLMLEIATQQGPNPGLQGIGSIPEKDRRQKDLASLPDNYPLRPLILSCLSDAPDQRPDAAVVLKELEKENSLNFQQAKKHLTACVQALLDCLNAIQAFLGQIQDCPTAVSTVSNHIHESLKRMVEATEQEQMKVVFLGNISNGKSTILNALLQEKVLFIGKGSTTTCVCTITGVPPCQLQSFHADGYLKTEDSQKMKLTELDSLMKQGSLKPENVLEIYLPTPASNVWLNKDIVLIDSPGFGADDATAEIIKKTCGGADVFVYVCDGTRTLEETVKKWLEQVNRQLPNLSKNLFILFNHWDRVVDDDEEEEEEEDGDSERLRRRHLQDVRKFLEQGLQASAILDRTFFVSGKEACKVLEIEKNGKQPSAAFKVLKRNWQERWTDFRKFESMLHAFLSGSAIQTKCGRHWKACTEFKSQLHEMMEQFKQWCSEEKEALGRDANLSTSQLERIDAAEHAVRQSSKEKVLSAMEEFSGMIDKSNDRIKNVLELKVEGYRVKLEDEKWADYQNGMTEHLDKEMKELLESVEEQMGTFAIDKIKHIQDTYAELINGTNEPQTQAGQDKPRLILKHPSISDMTKGYRARPWLGRAVIERDHKIEPVAVLTALIPPLNVLTFSLMGLVWAHERDEHLKQFKGKMIDRLRKKHLEAKNKAENRQCMDSLRNLLNCQVESLNQALTNRQMYLRDKIEDLQGRITECQSWINQATSFQDQLQQEVGPRLSRFCKVYLQGESA